MYDNCFFSGYQYFQMHLTFDFNHVSKTPQIPPRAEPTLLSQCMKKATFYYSIIIYVFLCTWSKTRCQSIDKTFVCQIIFSRLWGKLCVSSSWYEEKWMAISYIGGWLDEFSICQKKCRKKFTYRTNKR